jgi:hypothetical protein
MSIKDLLTMWALPDRSEERVQITLRLDFDQYARLHALKEIYPNRSVNDFLNDLIRAGLDDVVQALPAYTVTEDDVYRRMADPDEIGATTGPRINFEVAYRKILEQKSPDEFVEDAKADAKEKRSALKVLSEGGQAA